MKPIEQQIFHIIKSRGRGCIFSGAEFTDKFNSVNLDKTLSNLAKEKKIRRVIRGIYHFPNYNKLLEQYVSPKINKVAYTRARKFR